MFQKVYKPKGGTNQLMEEITIQISTEEKEVLLERASQKKFTSVEEYTQDIIKQVIKKIKEEHNGTLQEENGEERVKQRLAELGYLD